MAANEDSTAVTGPMFAMHGHRALLSLFQKYPRRRRTSQHAFPLAFIQTPARTIPTTGLRRKTSGTT
ncbi:hypothetical protein PSJ8397_02564 [Pseudooctadecabacter jejudonensis]|uniref:Uncharacterized protein n=1 Tax=Pseudooctadecabacter jejudonensis TaxID=1391910 RepID=A0A1Y5T0Y8_9RHOB|nr:hypothetical protein PSJ8397_02564 [Pseudooctadecabacter jejudonensis]